MIDIISVSPAKSSSKWLWVYFTGQMVNLTNLCLFIPLSYSWILFAIGAIGWIVLIWLVIFKHRFPLSKSKYISFSWRPARTWFRKSMYLNIKIHNKFNILEHGIDYIQGETTIIFEKEYDCLVHSFSIDFDSWVTKPNGGTHGERGFIYRVEFYNEAEVAMLILQYA